MSDFKIAIAFVLKNEGGLEVDPADPGGTTSFGLSQVTYPDVDILALTVDQAEAIYQRDFWIFGGIQSQRVATKVLDAYVNSKHHAIHQLQLALGTLQAGPIVADGNYGPSTEAHVNACDEDRLMKEFKARLCMAHCEDAIKNPAQVRDLLGWLRRDVDG